MASTPIEPGNAGEPNIVTAPSACATQKVCSTLDLSTRPLLPSCPIAVISVGTGLGGFELSLLRQQGVSVTRVFVSDIDPDLAPAHRKLLRYLQHKHPSLDVATSCASPLPGDVCAIDDTHLRALSIPANALVVITAGWECAPRSPAGRRSGIVSVGCSRTCQPTPWRVPPWCLQMKPSFGSVWARPQRFLTPRLSARAPPACVRIGRTASRPAHSLRLSHRRLRRIIQSRCRLSWTTRPGS